MDRFRLDWEKNPVKNSNRMYFPSTPSLAADVEESLLSTQNMLRLSLQVQF